MRVLIAALCAFLAIKPVSVAATTWVDAKVEDPIAQGASCAVMQPSSSGSYVYQAASKYDQVFWPLTDKNAIWFCAESGFAAFIGDFANLSAEEISRIKKFLADTPPVEPTMLGKLQRLEQMYGLRASDPILRNKLHRVLARWYQDLGQQEKANTYRAQALREIESSLARDLEEPQRLEYLYVAANYSRQLGNTSQSNDYLVKLTAALKAVSNAQLFDFRDYLSALLTHTQFIQAGGKLDPILPQPKENN